MVTLWYRVSKTSLTRIDSAYVPLLVASLQAVNDSKHLAGVTTGARGIHHSQADLFRWVDDEDGTNGEGNALFANVGHVLGVEHVVEESDIAVGVSDDGELQVGVANVVNVLDPRVVGGEVVGRLLGVLAAVRAELTMSADPYQSNHLDASLLELILHLCECTQLGCAHWREVCRVGEEDSPAVAEP